MPVRSVPLALQGAIAGGLLAAAAALLVIATLAIGAARDGDRAAARHAEAIVGQLAALAIEPLLTADLIELNLLVSRLAEHPASRHVAIYSIDDRLLAGAGSRLPEGEPELPQAMRPIAFDGAAIGQAVVIAERSAFTSEDFALHRALALLLAVAAGAVVGRLAGRRLASMLGDIARIVPGTSATETATDPLGTLRNYARELAARASEPSPALPGCIAIVNVFNQIALDVDDRARALAAALDAVRAQFRDIDARPYALPGTGVLVLLPDSADDPALHAIACALDALRAVESLNATRRHAGRIELHVRAAIEAIAELPGSSETDPVTALGGALSGPILRSAAVRTGTLAVPHDLFERVAARERLTFAAVRPPLAAGHRDRRFIYQVSDCAPPRAAPVTTTRD